MAAKKKQPPPTFGKNLRVGVLAVVAFALGMAAVFWIARRNPDASPTSGPDTANTKSDAEVYATYGGSASCKACHEAEYQLWEKSHHGLAERRFDAALDGLAFSPAKTIKHGTQSSEVKMADGKPQLVTAALGGSNKVFSAERVIGVDPLRQFLIPGEGGRWQTAELAFDPHRKEWFNVYGDEDRKPGEWGHWTGRGMTWNTMCAACHNTRLRKNYDLRTDSYRTAMAEMTVSCESCHGPMADHNAWQLKNPKKTGDPTIRKTTRNQIIGTCGSCHSRRSELTGDFIPGDSFFNHHQLTVPDETDTFYADGQVRDEDYELTAFLGSKMHAAGVRCIDCHEPHSAKTRAPGNTLCMTCHSTGTASVGGKLVPAPRIDPATHSHHTPGSRGDSCMACHMPQTTYMQRHVRHDHGFTIPDPRLTKELNIPNACNRCHTDKTADWSLENIVKWYGPRTNNEMRVRATAISKARADDHSAVPALLKMATSETNYFWRAVGVNLVKRWGDEANVTTTLLSAASDTNEFVRAMSARAMEFAAPSGASVQTALNASLDDPFRAVRIEAAWSLRRTLDTNSIAGKDLLTYLHHNADQPAGALQMGVFYLDRGDAVTALDYLQRAVKWDANSAPLHHALAIALSSLGRNPEALAALQTACRLAPRDAEYRYKLGLALNEVGNLAEATEALAEAVKLSPQFSRAWYNLGLAYSQQQRTDEALQALVRAEALDTTSPQIPYARATILARIGRTADARTAARRALELQPSHSEARGLLQSLER